jgi:hypothetical protein
MAQDPRPGCAGDNQPFLPAGHRPARDNTQHKAETEAQTVAEHGRSPGCAPLHCEDLSWAGGSRATRRNSPMAPSTEGEPRIGENVRAARRSRGISLEALAGLTGRSKG